MAEIDPISFGLGKCDTNDSDFSTGISIIGVTSPLDGRDEMRPPERIFPKKPFLLDSL